MGRNNLAGAWGEQLAASYLLKKRYTILATNYRCRYGELDIVAANKTHVVFVEVKLRKSASFAAAAEFVDSYKQERLRITADMYLSEYPTELLSRFDVIEIYAPQGILTPDPEINHLEDAFQ